VADGDRILAERNEANTVDSSLHADPQLPDDTRLWAALQDASGGTWAGAVYDVDKILEVLAAGRKALGR
jgi:xylonate dehydratase